MWKIFYTKKSRKDILCLDKDAVAQILKKLENATQKPNTSFEKITGFNYHKLRAGDYRAIVVLDFKEQIIEVRRVGHRKKIYKNMKN